LLRVNRLVKVPPNPKNGVSAVTTTTSNCPPPADATPAMSNPPVKSWQKSHFPDMTHSTYSDMTSFATFEPLSPLPESSGCFQTNNATYSNTLGPVPTTLVPKTCQNLSSMHELSYSLLQSRGGQQTSRPTIVDRRDPLDGHVTVEEDTLGGQGK